MKNTSLASFGALFLCLFAWAFALLPAARAQVPDRQPFGVVQQRDALHWLGVDLPSGAVSATDKTRWVRVVSGPADRGWKIGKSFPVKAVSYGIGTGGRDVLILPTFAGDPGATGGLMEFVPEPLAPARLCVFSNSLFQKFDGQNVGWTNYMEGFSLLQYLTQGQFRCQDQSTWGFTTAQLLASMPARMAAADAAWTAQGAFGPRVAVVAEATNTFYTGGSVASAVADTRAAVNLLRSAGWYVVVVECPRRTQAGTPEDYDQKRNAYNYEIRPETWPPGVAVAETGGYDVWQNTVTEDGIHFKPHNFAPLAFMRAIQMAAFQLVPKRGTPFYVVAPSRPRAPVRR